MAQDIELCDYATINETMRTAANSAEQSGKSTSLFRLEVSFVYLGITSMIVCVIIMIYRMISCTVYNMFVCRYDTHSEKTSQIWDFNFRGAVRHTSHSQYHAGPCL